jgi:glycosyltransferase involved in cell wall biosynthesis
MRPQAAGRTLPSSNRASGEAVTGTTAFFTIVSRNYIAYAVTLMQTVARHHPDATRYVFLADADYDFSDLDIPATIVTAERLAIPGFSLMAFRYTIIELNTAIKPFCIEWLFSHAGYDRAIYLDPDIFVLRRLDDVMTLLDRGAPVVLTPHITAPLQDGYQPDDLTIMKSGIYNLGFGAFARTPAVHSFLGWWAARLVKQCRVDIPNHLFTDQRWMDLAPAFLPGTAILHHPGYNVAYWNLLHRPVSRGRGGWRAAGQPLYFVHFSGVDPLNSGQFSKHQTRFRSENIAGLLPLFESYVAQLLTNGYEKYEKSPYAYGRFSDGRQVHTLMRHYFRRCEDTANPLTGVSLGAESGIFDEAEPTLDEAGLPRITRIMYQLWLQREDLQRAFALDTEGGRRGYLMWFGKNASAEEGLDERSIHAAATLLAASDVGQSDGTARIGAARRRPPWDVAEPWSKAARDAASYLEARVDTTHPTPYDGLPRQMAILWETRTDLQSAFPLTKAEDFDRYVDWCVTSGIDEAQIDPELIDARFWELLDAPVASGDYEGMPITRGMWAACSVFDRREITAGFPQNKSSRVELALWFLLVAPHKYRWPAAMTRSLRAYVEAPVVTLTAFGVKLPRLLLLLWESRQDLCSTFDLSEETGRRALLAWFLFEGLAECGLTGADLPSDFYRDLFAAARNELPPIHRLLRWRRPDISGVFDARSKTGRRGYLTWFEEHGRHELASDAVFPPSSSIRSDGTKATRNQAEAPGPLVVLTGFISMPSGRSEDMRMTMRSLDAHAIPYLTLDRGDGVVRLSDGRKADPELVSRARVNIVHLNAETAFADHQFLRRYGIGNATLIGYWAWELAKMPAEYARAFSFYDEIWAATRFTMGAFDIGYRPVKLMPMPVAIPADLADKDRRYFRLPERRFMFLFNFDFGSYRARKNPDATIAAFHRAFPEPNAPVCLVIKTINGEHYIEEWKKMQEMALGDPRVIMRNGLYSREEMLGLIGCCDCYISLHRSEGFGRGPAEAMLLGRPVIITNYSGNRDFTTTDNSFPVDYRLVPVAEGEYPGDQDQVWAEPDIAGAATQMRRVYEEPGLAEETGRRARSFIETFYSPERIGRNYLERLSELVPVLGRSLDPLTRPVPHLSPRRNRRGRTYGPWRRAGLAGRAQLGGGRGLRGRRLKTSRTTSP